MGSEPESSASIIGSILDIISISDTGGRMATTSTSTSEVRNYGTSVSEGGRVIGGDLGENISKGGSITLESLSWNILWVVV